MTSSGPPSSQRTPADTQRLRVAHGSVRDTLGAIRNLEQLLRSIRVGPRDIAEILPVSQDSLEPLRRSIQELLTGVQEGAPLAVAELNAYIFPRIDELDAALKRSIGARISAKHRLQLEDVVTRTVRDLDAARFLWELLEESMAGTRAPVNLADLFRQSFGAVAPPAHGGSELVPVQLHDVRASELEVSTSVATALLSVAVQLSLVKRGTGPVHAVVGEESKAVLVGPSTTTERVGEALQVPNRRLIAPSFACATAAARLSGSILAATGPHEFRLRFE